MRILRVVPIIAAVLLLSHAAMGQLALAQPTLPTLTVDTTYSLPVGGTTWAAHNTAQFNTALSSSAPGDVIVLDAGVTYTGSFMLFNKVNPSNKWIYIISSDLASLPAGTRVSPASVSHMPKIITNGALGSTTTFNVPNGSNYWRLVGLEITGASNYPTGCGSPALHCITNSLFQQPYPPTNPIQNHLIIDRVYGHGEDVQDIQGAFALNCNYCGIIDSYVSNVHMKGTDSWATGGNWGGGPFIIDNNYLEASSENIIFGGSGKGILGNVPSDMTVTNNTLFKPLSWIPLSVGNHSMVVKNAFEIKSGQRILFDHNVIQNVWADGQLGSAIVLTVRSSQSGDIAVVNDVTITNNLVLNVVKGVNTLASDDNCGIPPYTACTVAGSQSRWNIYNNLFTFFDPSIPGGNNNILMAFNPGIDRPNNTLGMMKNVILQHNTAIPSPGHNCWASVYFNNPNSFPPAPHVTQNIWILDNVFCGLPYGNNGGGLTPGLNTYMPYPTTPPNDINARFYGNEMYAQGGSLLTWPTGNLPTNTAFTYDANNIVTNPPWTTTAGPPSPPFQSGFMGLGGSPVLLSVSVTPAGPIILIGANQQFTATANYSDGSQVDVTTSATWASASTGIATIGASTGLAHGVAQGSSAITATYSALVGPATLTVIGTGASNRAGMGGAFATSGKVVIK